MAGPDLTGDQGLAEHVGQRQPQELHVVRAQQPAGLLSDPLVRPAVVHQAHTLRAARRARGVDQGGELFPLDGPNRLLDRVRMLIQVRRTPLLQLGEGEHLQPLHPREVRPGIEEDRVAEPWQAFDGGGDLVQLDRVLDEDRPGCRSRRECRQSPQHGCWGRRRWRRRPRTSRPDRPGSTPPGWRRRSPPAPRAAPPGPAARPRSHGRVRRSAPRSASATARHRQRRRRPARDSGRLPGRAWLRPVRGRRAPRKPGGCRQGTARNSH